jgi:hypothetical protein
MVPLCSNPKEQIYGRQAVGAQAEKRCAQNCGFCGSGEREDVSQHTCSFEFLDIIDRARPVFEKTITTTMCPNVAWYG